MVVFAASRKPVRLRGELLVLRWTRLLERNRLEVTRRDGLRVVPADLQCPDAHYGCIMQLVGRAEVEEMVVGREAQSVAEELSAYWGCKTAFTGLLICGRSVYNMSLLIGETHVLQVLRRLLGMIQRPPDRGTAMSIVQRMLRIRCMSATNVQ